MGLQKQCLVVDRDAKIIYYSCLKPERIEQKSQHNLLGNNKTEDFIKKNNNRIQSSRSEEKLKGNSKVMKDLKRFNERQQSLTRHDYKLIEQENENRVKKSVEQLKMNLNMNMNMNMNGNKYSEIHKQRVQKKEKYYMENLMKNMVDQEGEEKTILSNHFLHYVCQTSLIYLDRIFQAVVSRLNLVAQQSLLEQKKNQMFIVYLQYHYHIDNKTVILDLDETLIHCSTNSSSKADHLIQFDIMDQKIQQCSLFIRPFAKQLLQQLSKLAELIVFTASSKSYADKILSYLDPQNTLIHHTLYRQHCYNSKKGIYIKYLNILQNRNLNDIVIVDNSPYSYLLNIHNAIPIIPYYGQPDTELVDLLRYLKQIFLSSDATLTNKQQFKLSNYIQANSVKQTAQLFLNII